VKVITVTGSWLNGFSKLERPVRVSQVFGLADRHRWAIRVGGQHWDASNHV
jgi:UV DNA damage repair endonuclease